MKPIYEASVIQIEVTNNCNHICANCTRFVGHHKRPYFMDLETIEKAIDSLDGYTGMIGCMGGEPSLHPKFADICKIFQEKIPDKNRRGLWTDGINWNKYDNLIRETFPIDNIVYNDHSSDDKGYHQQLLIGSDEIIDDKELMWELIDNCWVQKRWSPSINPKGCFFCEVAAAMDVLFDGPGGWPMEQGWWNKTPEDPEFQEQVKRYCPMCSAAIPLDIASSHSNFDFVSPENAKRLEKVASPKFLSGKMKIYDKPYTREEYERNVKNWKPGFFREFYQHEPGVRIYHDKVSGKKEIKTVY